MTRLTQTLAPTPTLDGVRGKKPRITYLGPEGTFTEQALRTLPEVAGTDLASVETVAEALTSVYSGAADAAMVPLHNTVGGMVADTIRALAEPPGLVVLREVTLSIVFALLVRPHTPLAAVRTVAGHPHARPQVAGWLGEFLPGARWVPAPSNAVGARWAREGRCDAAVAGEFAAPRYGLAVAAERIQDHPRAETRFLLVARP